MKTEAQIRRDVTSDMTRPHDRATIQRRHPKVLSDAGLIEAEVRMRLAIQELPSVPSRSAGGQGDEEGKIVREET